MDWGKLSFNISEKTELKIMLFFTIYYLLLFTILAIIKHNYEFLFYTFFMSIMIIMVVLYHKKIHLSFYLMVGLTLMGALHIYGGNIYINSIRLYDYWLIDGIFKYDNLVHTIGIAIATIVAYNILNPHLDEKLKHNRILLSLILILIAMGIGAMNEIIELLAVVFLNASSQVGDYMNNALDLVFNMIGSMLACLFLSHYHHKRIKHD